MSFTLTYADAIVTYQGLVALSSYADVVKDGGREQVVQKPFDLSVNTRVGIARNIAAIRSAIAPIEQALRDTARAIQAAPEHKTDAERDLEAAMAQEEAARTTVDLKLTPLSLNDLKLETNKAITPIMLMQLARILNDADIGPQSTPDA